MWAIYLELTSLKGVSSRTQRHPKDRVVHANEAFSRTVGEGVGREEQALARLRAGRRRRHEGSTTLPRRTDRRILGGGAHRAGSIMNHERVGNYVGMAHTTPLWSMLKRGSTTT